jgi:hypothetical protein
MIIRTPPKITNRNSVVKYVEIDLWSWLKELSIGLLKIDFLQNFQSFRVNDLKIPAGVEVAIPNNFRTAYPGVIPSSRIIVRQKGDANIIDGDTVWTENQVFLKNPSANDATISVIFFK